MVASSKGENVCSVCCALKFQVFCEECCGYYCNSCSQEVHNELGDHYVTKVVEMYKCQDCGECNAVLKCTLCAVKLCDACCVLRHASNVLDSKLLVESNVLEGKTSHEGFYKRFVIVKEQGVEKDRVEAISNMVSKVSLSDSKLLNKSMEFTSSTNQWDTSWPEFTYSKSADFTAWKVDKIKPAAMPNSNARNITETYTSLKSLPAVTVETEKEVLEDKPNFRVMQIEQIKALLQMGEKPTRNLLIVFDEKLKIQFSANGFYEALQRFGDIQHFNFELASVGVLLVAYYDIYAAIQAEYQIKSSGIVADATNYAHSKTMEFPDACFCSTFEYRAAAETSISSLVLTVPTSTIAIQDVRQFCSVWGPVYNIISHKNIPMAFHVEYGDLRHCAKGLREIRGTNRWGSVLKTQQGPLPSTIEMDNLREFQISAQEIIRRMPSHNYMELQKMNNAPNAYAMGNNGYAYSSSYPTNAYVPYQPYNMEPAQTRYTASTTGYPVPQYSLYSPSHGYHTSSHAGRPSSQYMYAPHETGRQRAASFSGEVDRKPSRYIDQRRTSNPRTDVNPTEFNLILNNVFNGVDTRTTLMIRNIPNKYTQLMILKEINQNYKEQYDFFYLPIDFKNKCNMGYAFINFIDCSAIVRFYQEFSDQRWRNFNSEKVCAISYARLQGKAAMIARFQNSSLLFKDASYRPLVFCSSGSKRGQPETFPVGTVGRKTYCEGGYNSFRENEISVNDMSARVFKDPGHINDSVGQRVQPT